MITQLEIKSFINYFITQNFLEIMKKKMLLVAVAISALTLGACVDDNESQSVTDVRTAKAEQLKSIAAMNNATAEATSKLAEANAALITAQAEATKATTELAKVQVELAKVEVQLQETKVEEEKVKLEKLKTELENKQADLEEKKAEVAANLQIIAANLEANLMQAKIALQQAQIQFNNNLSTLEAADRAKLTDLMNIYTLASNNLLVAQQNSATEKIYLAKLESGLISAQEINAINIKKQQANIANYQAIIDLDKAYAGVSKEEATQQYNDALNQLTTLSQKGSDSQTALTNASTAYSNAQTSVNNSAYCKKLTSSETLTSINNAITSLSASAHGTGSNTESWTYTKVVSGKSVKVTLIDNAQSSVDDEIIGDDGILLGTAGAYNAGSYSKITKYYSLNKTGFDTFITDLTKIATDAAKATADAKTALDADPTNTTLENSYNTAKADQEAAETNLKEIKAVYDYLTAQASAFDALAKDYMDKNVAYNETTWAQSLKDNHATNLQYQEVSILSNIMINSFDAEGDIQTQENRIQAANDIIATAQKNGANMEATISNSKLKIANLETEIAVYQKQMDTAKANLDAAMK